MLLLLVLQLSASGCARQETESMSPEDLYTLIQSDEPPLILDVRTLREYRSGHIPGAIHRPFHQLLGSNHRAPAESETTLLIYCEHGPRAGIAGWGLRRSGFLRVVALDGHMSAWKKRNLPLEFDEGETSEGH